MKIVTHDSSFHTDDVFAVATLLLLVGEAEVVRSRDPEVCATADYLVDTGMKYDPEKNFFDHHQPEGAGKRENGIPYASFGLVWKEYGEKLAGGKREAEIIDKYLIQAIDAHDNGVVTAEPKFEDLHQYNMGDFFNSFINLRDPEALHKTFIQVVDIARELLSREIKIAQKLIKDQDKVLVLYNESKDKRLVVMTEALIGWREVLGNTPDAIYAIYPRPDGHWSIGTIQNGSYVPRKSLPYSWAGLAGKELERITGVSGAIFCHRALFMAAAETKEAAVTLAEIALKA